jgi:hypothetical protein
MLHDLMAVEALISSLAMTAPLIVAKAGGARCLLRPPHRRMVLVIAPLPDGLWERMANEHQAAYRSNVGEV